MRKILLVILIIIELIVIFSAFLFSKNKEKIKRNYLRIEKNNFIDQDNNIVQLKGVSTMAFARNEYDLTKLTEIFTIFKKNGVNLITLYLYPDKTYPTLAKLDYLIYWAKYNSIFVYLVPVIDVNDYRNHQQRIASTKELSLKLIERYKDESHVIYGVWAEPYAMSWEEWKFYHKDFVDRSRLIKKDIVIGISGLDNGRRFFGGLDFDYKNIFLDFHDYPAKNIEELKKTTVDGFLWDKYIDRYPIMIGEFGGVYHDGFGAKEDNDYFKRVIDNANKFKLSYVGYTVDRLEDAGGQSLIDWNTKKLTEKGKIFVESLNK